ncbi:MAG: hypothetical protein J4478_01110 [Candidatus Diapherotrites archaeon]|uniref:Class III signal peptide-containing protein n=1 Tax=Candidatus Iainarchaeum sp. TaxID=3101447 RepID=A0A7J4JVS1_9ARCH|nr:MAG: hypothetical protein QT12_C0018G0007 [archaeon GW2011_AR21]MBS3057983.1 hypothetical protein [Candidatus Diapherotrites archaeon]HIH21828.1 hypothetical protein [Candidatus Diapherotrites archaeon]
MNIKGQESATFEFLVVAIMGLFIMVIMLSIVNYFTDLRFQASEQRFNDALHSAVSSPNGEAIIAKNIILQPGKISSESLAEKANIPSSCVEIDAIDLVAFKLSPDNTVLSVERSVETTVYLKCVLGPEYGSGTDCEESCIASFGKEFSPRT